MLNLSCIFNWNDANCIKWPPDKLEMGSAKPQRGDQDKCEIPQSLAPSQRSSNYNSNGWVWDFESISVTTKYTKRISFNVIPVTCSYNFFYYKQQAVLSLSPWLQMNWLNYTLARDTLARDSLASVTLASDTLAGDTLARVTLWPE